MGKIIAFSGTHGTGKTKSAADKFSELKVRHRTCSVDLVCNVAGRSPYPVNQAATEAGQLWMFAKRIELELTAIDRFDIVVTDRTLVDIIAYTVVAGFQETAQGMLAIAGRHMHQYKEIHVKQLDRNSFCYADGIRASGTPEYRKEIEHTIMDTYKHLADTDVYPGNIYYV